MELNPQSLMIAKGNEKFGFGRHTKVIVMMIKDEDEVAVESQ